MLGEVRPVRDEAAAPGVYAMRRFLPEDREKLLDILGEIWGGDFRADMARTWSWKYDRNPHHLPGGHNSMVMTCDGEPVGFLGLLSTWMKVDDRIYPIAWGSELALLKEHRPQGYRFFLEIASRSEKLIAGTASSYDLARLPIKFGAYEITRLMSFKRMLLPRRFLRSQGMNPVLAVLGAAPVALASGLVRLVLRGPVDRSAVIEEVGDFGPEFDDLWEEIAPTFAMVAVRDRAFLNWRFRDCPNRRYTTLAARRSGRLAGYVIVREEDGGSLRRGFVVDLMAPQDDRALSNRLLEAADSWFRSRGVAEATCTISNHRGFRRMLRTNGYLFTSARAWITGHCGCRPEHAGLQEHFEQSTRLLMTRADTDLDYNY